MCMSFCAQDASLCICVLVRFIPREDLFPQQALSGCFWANSVHSWRQLLSPAYLTHLLASFLLSSRFPILITDPILCQNINDLLFPTQWFFLLLFLCICFFGSFLQTTKPKENRSFIVGSKITPKRLKPKWLHWESRSPIFYGRTQYKGSLNLLFSKALNLQLYSVCLEK